MTTDTLLGKKKRSGSMKIDQWRALSERDSLLQTVGCRHSNPNICRNHSTEGKCAFVHKENLCLLPPRSWKDIFHQLKQRQLSDTKIE